MSALDRTARCVAALALTCAGWPLAAMDEFERPPISYSEAVPDNAVTRLQARLDSGDVRLEHVKGWGYLRSVLAELSVPVSSQTLVFSKTSLQFQRISPHSPRALYFNDDVYVGYVRLGDVVELSVADPKLGTVFYTLSQKPADHPTFARRTNDCLLCHGGAQPSHVVRSVYPDASGQPLLSAGASRVDHTTPFERRWGGWYVTGTHGSATHLGNVTYRERSQMPVAEEPPGPDVGDRFNVNRYLSGHSDLVALTVLAHQAFAHNAITKASFEARTALYREAELNRELGEPAGHRWPSTETVLNAAAQSLVECFLFCGEPKLAAPIAGTSDFAKEFAGRGPFDSRSRSLRALDLNTRLFRYPCSYLIYTASFDALPEDLRDRFWARMDAVLGGTEQSPRFAHLSAANRTAIREILGATKAGAPAAWKSP